MRYNPPGWPRCRKPAMRNFRMFKKIHVKMVWIWPKLFFAHAPHNPARTFAGPSRDLPFIMFPTIFHQFPFFVTPSFLIRKKINASRFIVSNVVKHGRKQNKTDRTKYNNADRGFPAPPRFSPPFAKIVTSPPFSSLRVPSLSPFRASSHIIVNPPFHITHPVS